MQIPESLSVSLFNVTSSLSSTIGFWFYKGVKSNVSKVELCDLSMTFNVSVTFLPDLSVKINGYIYSNICMFKN